MRSRAERAFERALALNPDLAMAHHLYAHFEAEIGRAGDAMVRLLTRARAWQSDAELFAGLTTVCRYVGLLDESLAAFERARQLDPDVRSSVAFTHFMRQDFSKVVETDSGSPGFAALLARCRMGPSGVDAAIEECRRIEQSTQGGIALVAAAYRLAITGPTRSSSRFPAAWSSRAGSPILKVCTCSGCSWHMQEHTTSRWSCSSAP